MEIKFEQLRDVAESRVTVVRTAHEFIVCSGGDSDASLFALRLDARFTCWHPRQLREAAMCLSTKKKKTLFPGFAGSWPYLTQN